MSWQRQRLAAPAASTVSVGCVSGPRGWAGRSRTQDSPQALERSVHGLGLLPPLPCLPPRGVILASTEVSCRSHWCAWEVSRGQSMGTQGPWSACRHWVHMWESRRGPRVRWGLRLCMDRALAAFLHSRPAAFGSECTWDACTRFKACEHPQAKAAEGPGLPAELSCSLG